MSPRRVPECTRPRTGASPLRCFVLAAGLPASRVLLLVSGLLAACGKRGDPLPPLPRTPQAASLRLAQRGSELEARVEAPRLTTSGAALQALEVELLKAQDDGPFEKIARRTRRKAAPGERITERDPLPPPGTLVRAAARAWSGRERSAAGPVVSLKVQPVPPTPEGFGARLEKQGVVLRWKPLPPPAVPPPAAPSPSPTPPSPASPAAPSSAGPPPGAAPSPPAPLGFWVYRRDSKGEFGAPLSQDPVASPTLLDAAVAEGETWCYVVRTVASREPLVESAASSEACVVVKDVFAPDPPTGVSALAQGDLVEVSWSPSADADLQGYRVLRGAGGGPLERIGELAAPERVFRDKNVTRGETYVYQVTAVDRLGNESPPSAPAECRLP